MADRTVRVRLSAQVQEYIDGMEKAAQATRQTGSEGQKLAQQRAAFQSLGTAMVSVGGAITAVGLAAVKTGIDYNSMQQSSRAALLSMLGSTEAVNAQMDKLDDFARNSPFAKQTFIEAQQQMLAFGIETERVIPYLDAMQNAVAAAGGSNQDIAELAEIFGKISSSSKITAVDLQQFGRRGINAAELIGQAMGKTGAEIREEITAGTLDADAALEALASGMATRFSGAADNVKQTFDGAMDRVKAAWRDFSSELARPLVDPEGGGMLVDFLNGLADTMRKFEDLPGPVKAVTTGLIGLVGAISLTGGTAFLMLPKIAEYRQALVDLDLVGGRLHRTLGFVGRAAGLAAIGGAIVLLSREAEPELASLTNALERSADAMDLVGEAAKAQESKAGWLRDALPEIALGATEVADALDYAAKKSDQGLFRIEPADRENLNEYIETLGILGDEIAAVGAQDFPKMQESLRAISDEYNLTERQQWAFIEGSSELRRVLEGAAGELDMTTDRADLLALAFGDVAPAVDVATDATDDNIQSLEELAGAAQSTSDEVGSLADEIRNFGSAQMDAEEAAIKFHEELETLNKRVAEGATGLDINTQAGRDNRQSLLDMAAATNDSAAATFAATGEQSALNSRLEQGRTALYNAAIQFGMTEAEAKAYADQLIATPESIQTYVKLNGIAEASMAIDTFVARHNGRAITIHVRQDGASTRQLLNEGADGFIEEYARGGLEEYAAGGFSPGIYRGGAPIHKFAEHETIWEAYISGKPSERDRNRQIWVEAGDRLGMGDVLKALQQGTGRQAPVAPSGPVNVNVYDRDDVLIGTMRGEIADALSPLSRGRQRSVLGRG